MSRGVISIAKSLHLVGVAALPTRVTVTIEVPRGAFVKRDGTGRIDFVSPLPCPFNYGCIATIPGLDGEPLDALVLGPPLRLGISITSCVRAVMGFTDAGIEDPKVVCSERPLSRPQRREVERFFRVYALAKRSVQLLRLRPNAAVTAVRGWA